MFFTILAVHGHRNHHEHRNGTAVCKPDSPVVQTQHSGHKSKSTSGNDRRPENQGAQFGVSRATHGKTVSPTGYQSLDS
jgi:hypothetical protein